MAQEEKCLRTYSEVTSVMRSLGKLVQHTGPHKAEEIEELEKSFGILFPLEYRQFLGNYGACFANGSAILGLGKPQQTGMPVADAILMLRLSHTAMPLDLVPIEDLGEGHFACLVARQTKSAVSPVVEVDINNPLPVEKLPQLAACFRDYLYDRLIQIHRGSQSNAKNAALGILERHVKSYQSKFTYDHAKGGKLPRNHDWRPYRFCVQDVLFGATVVRHWRDYNCLQVDVFLTARIPEYDPLAGAHALSAFLLSEAYKCGGTMEIRFTENIESGRVPAELKQLASRYGVQVGKEDKDRITPAEAKAFYAALTDLPVHLQEKINALEKEGKIKMARACFAVHNGVWTKEQVEMLVLGSQRPDSVLAGLTLPSERHLYSHDLLHARAALLGGMLDLRLSMRQRVAPDGATYDLEDDLRPLEIAFDGESYSKRYRSIEKIVLPWVYAKAKAVEIPASQEFQVLVRARDVADLFLHLEEDIDVAEQVRSRSNSPTFILVPSDITLLPEELTRKISASLKRKKIELLVCPETVSTFDSDAAQRLARSRVLRK